MSTRWPDGRIEGDLFSGAMAKWSFRAATSWPAFFRSENPPEVAVGEPKELGEKSLADSRFAIFFAAVLWGVMNVPSRFWLPEPAGEGETGFIDDPV
jgi:hypothetical protein